MLHTPKFPTQKDFENRSKEYKDSYESVLPRKFPRLLNEYLDEWTAGLVENNLPEGKIRVLDIGCGYGRVERRIKNKNRLFFGLDISINQISFYAKENTTGIVSRCPTLPFRGKTFDFVFMITTLMYLNKEEQKKCIKEIERVLKNNGKYLLIEPNKIGTYISNPTLYYKSIRGYPKTLGWLFEHKEIEALIGKNQILKKEGIPFFSLLIPLLFVLYKFLKNPFFLQQIQKLDIRFKELTLPSHYIAYLVKKD